ncbi:36978_t:CDS:2 [Racocetra persica]|uniref:36978_t:CDS:1 n=1 Tax=Racocetra persica TaxID=160502 RepID=A0ACA9RF90_9GLOM|nr:36978_t:CDS:2 [Racocetra persica]
MVYEMPSGNMEEVLEFFNVTSDYSLENIKGEELIKRYELPVSSARYNPDAYIKPLDIIKVFGEGGSLRHACVYLGNKKFAHSLGKDNEAWVED